MLEQLPCGCGLLAKLAGECQKKCVKQVTFRMGQAYIQYPSFSSKAPTNLMLARRRFGLQVESGAKNKLASCP